MVKRTKIKTKKYFINNKSRFSWNWNFLQTLMMNSRQSQTAEKTRIGVELKYKLRNKKQVETDSKLKWQRTGPELNRRDENRYACFLYLQYLKFADILLLSVGRIQIECISASQRNDWHFKDLKISCSNERLWSSPYRNFSILLRNVSAKQIKWLYQRMNYTELTLSQLNHVVFCHFEFVCKLKHEPNNNYTGQIF